MPTIRVVNQDITKRVQLKCLKLIFVGKFLVDVVIPDQFSKAMVHDDQTAKAMEAAVMKRYQVFLTLAKDRPPKVEENIVKEPELGQRKKMAEELEKELNHELESYKGSAPAAAQRVWDAYVQNTPNQSCHIKINVTSGAKVTVTANNVGLK
jgi:hypothetical protein